GLRVRLLFKHSALQLFVSLLLSIFFLRTRRPPSSTLFPYTTLFRSFDTTRLLRQASSLLVSTRSGRRATRQAGPWPSPSVASTRSEEHTSELQSQSNLVCRLLLEKKKK